MERVLVWMTRIAAFAQAESACQAANPNLLYADLLAATHRTLARNWGRESDEAESIRFGQSVGDWPAFADAAESLAYLKRHHRLITLTNCDRTSYRGSAARLGDPWDAILTAEEIGSYKPSLANFEFLLARVSADYWPSDMLRLGRRRRDGRSCITTRKRTLPTRSPLS